MYKGMYVAASGALAAQRTLDTLTNNLANISTPGFKGDQLTFESYLSKSDREQAAKSLLAPVPTDSEYVVATGQYTNFEQGALRITGAPLDVALKGEGFISVITYEGERYTRAGHFQVGNNGELVNLDGHPVLDATDRLIYVNESFVTIDKDGVVWLTNADDSTSQPRKAGKIKVVEFDDFAKLTKEGNGLFRYDDPGGVFAAMNTKVVQGSLEGSNVNMIREMTDLIRNQRMAETFKKVIQENDAMTTQLIVNVGRP